jgi:hypothetical protein
MNAGKARIAEMNADKAQIVVNIGGTGQLEFMPELNALLREGIQLIQDTIAKMGGTVQDLPSSVWIKDGVMQFSLPMEFQAGRLREFFGQPREPADHTPRE